MHEKRQLKNLIFQPDFYYEEPYYYSLIYSLRCALGKGKGPEKKVLSARQRAKEIFAAVFDEGVDAVIVECYDFSPQKPAEVELIKERKAEPINSPWVERWKQFPYTVVNKEESYWSKKDGDINFVIQWHIFRVEGEEQADFAQILADNLCEHRMHFVSCKNNCILTVVSEEECNVVCGDRDCYSRLYDKLEAFLLPEGLKYMKRIKNHNMFIDSATRKNFGGTGYFEFQYCKEQLPFRKLIKGSGRFWLEDSLYFYMDYDRIFFYDYGEYFSRPTTPNGKRVFDCWGSNYYTKEQAAEIVKAIGQNAPVDSEILIPWLERAATEFNGFYICGI